MIRSVARSLVALGFAVGVASMAETTGPHGPAASASNSATLTKAREIRAKLAAAGFSDVVNLQEREGGTWSCRAIRSDTTVRLEIDRDGKISIV